MIAELAGLCTYLMIYSILQTPSPAIITYSHGNNRSSQLGHPRRKGSVTELQDCGGQHEYENKLSLNITRQAATLQ